MASRFFGLWLAVATLFGLVVGCGRVRDLASPSPPPPSPSPAALGPRVYITDGQKGVYAISCTDQQMAEQFPIAGGAADIDISPDGRILYATVSRAAQTMLYQTSGLPLGRMAVGSMPCSLALSQDGARAYVANRGSKDVSVLATKERKELRRVSTGDSPYDLVAGGKDDRFCVCLHDSNQVALFDGSTGSELARVRVGLHPYHLARDPEGAYLYVTVFDENVLAVLDASTLEVRGRVMTGEGPLAVTASRAGRVYVTNLEGGSVTVVEREKWDSPSEFAIGSRPTTMALSPDEERLYVTLEGNENLQVCSAASLDQRITVSFGMVPIAVFPGRPANTPTP